MPTLQSMELPRPSNWQEFEKIVRDAMSQKWRGSRLTMNGRSGQKQFGVDIVGVDDVERLVGIQCKLTFKKLTIQVINLEIEKAEKLAPPLKTLYIATTAENDAILQAKLRKVSADRVAKNKFSVGILYWDDIISGLTLNEKVFSNHYPGILIPQKKNLQANDSMIAALELGYYGGDLENDLNLIFSEYGEMAHTDPDELGSKLTIIQRRIRQLLAPDQTQKLIESLETIEKFIDHPTQKDFDSASHATKRATRRIRDIPSLLSGQESEAMSLGVKLKRMYYIDGELDQETRKKIRQRITKFIGKNNGNIKPAFKQARDKTAYIWSVKIYNFLAKELRLHCANRN